MTTHFSILAWKIPWTEEPDGLQSMGSPEMSEHNKNNNQVTDILLLFITPFFFLISPMA